MESQDFHLIVLGAGPSGLTVASALAKLKYRVLIVDFPDKSLKKISKNSEQPTQVVDSKFGGNARYWGGQIAYMTIEDLRRFGELSNLSFEQQEMIKQEMLSLSMRLDVPYDSQNSYTHLFSEKALLTFPNVYSTYVGNLDISNYLNISEHVAGGFITFLEAEIETLDFQNGRCTSIRLSNHGMLEVSTNGAVCISLGTLNSTILIQRSLDIQRDIRFDVVLDHPHGYIAAFSRSRKSKFYRSPTLRQGKHIFKRKFKIESFSSQNQGIVEFHYDYLGNFFPEILDFRMRQKVLFKQYLNKAFRKLFKRNLFSPEVYWAWLQIEQESRREEGSKLRSSHPFKMELRLDSQDLDDIVCMQSQLINEMRKKGFRLLWEASPEFILSNFQCAFHPCSTLPMSTNDSDSLVEPFGKIRGTPNLFMASSASWSVSSWVNPTFMIMTFAKLVSDEILSFLDQQFSGGNSN